MNEIENKLEELEEMVINMDEVDVVIPWKVAKNLLQRAGYLSEEEHRLLSWRLGKSKYAGKRSEKVRNLLEGLMALSNKKKVDAGMFKVSLRKNKKVEVLDETKIPLEYMTEKIERKPDKKELAKLLKTGQEIAGVELIETESLQVK